MEPTPVSGRTTSLVEVLVLLTLPVTLVVIEAVSYHVAHRNNGTLVSSGQTREYLLYVPRSYDGTRPTPLVISLHGGAMWPAAQQDTSQWSRLAEREGFIVVYPSGAGGDGPRVWNVNRGPGLMKDVRFIADLMDTLKASYNIDGARVYADGLSNGAGMAFVLSCTLSDRIAADGMVAAAQLLPWSWCTDDRPVPMMTFHGTADGATPYHGGMSWVAPVVFPDIPAWTAHWARRNQCGPRPVESTVAADVTRVEYTQCADDAAVVLYTIHDGGHTWPGGGALPEWFVGATTRSIDATSLMWAFFRDHPL